MKKLIIVIVLTTFSINVNAQKNKLSFDFGYGINNFSMKNLNQFYIDSFASKLDYLDNHIEKGFNSFVAIKYQPLEIFDIGFYSNYIYGETNGNPKFVETDNFGTPLNTHTGNFKLYAESIGFGITNSWYISHILNFKSKKSKFIQNFRIATEINIGVAFSKSTTDYRFTNYQLASSYNFYTSKDFDLQLALKFEYDIVKQPLVSTIGLKFGYKQLKTKTLNNIYQEEWKTLNKPINLDFSGFFGSIYLSFGK